MTTRRPPDSPLEVLERFREKGLPENFCIIPFVNLILNPDGNVGVCRQKGTRHSVGNLADQSIPEIWNGEYLRRWRSEFLTGQVSICESEIRRDRCNVTPENYRIWDHAELAAEQSGPYLKLTANFNGKCNLECVMCDIWKLPNGYYDQIGFWEEAETEVFPKIREVEMLSGEPFVQKDTYRLIDAVARVNPECLWSFTTNGHWKFTDAVRRHLDRIRINTIIVSIDSLRPERYAAIRRGGDLSLVLATMRDLLEYREQRRGQGRDFTLCLHFLVMRQNRDECGEVARFCREHGLKLTLNYLQSPLEHSLDSLPVAERKEMLLSLIADGSTEDLSWLSRLFTSALHDFDPFSKLEVLCALAEKRGEAVA